MEKIILLSFLYVYKSNESYVSSLQIQNFLVDIYSKKLQMSGNKFPFKLIKNVLSNIEKKGFLLRVKKVNRLEKHNFKEENLYKLKCDLEELNKNFIDDIESFP